MIFLQKFENFKPYSNLDNLSYLLSLNIFLKSSPDKTIVGPYFSTMSFFINLAIDVLPEPTGPIIPIVSPLLTLNDIFFSASINSTNDGESHSAASVRESLKKLISTEPLNSPLSDEALVTKLQTEGINLARRTVAKYRELMNIPSSSMRRRMMKIQSLNV